MKNISLKELQKLPKEFRKAMLGTVVIQALKVNAEEWGLTIEDQHEVLQSVTNAHKDVLNMFEKDKEKQIKEFFEKLKNEDEGEIEYETSKH